jgi:hypothetical protein
VSRSARSRRTAAIGRQADVRPKSRTSASGRLRPKDRLRLSCTRFVGPSDSRCFAAGRGAGLAPLIRQRGFRAPSRCRPREPDGLMKAWRLSGCVALSLTLKFGRGACTDIALAPGGTERWQRIVLVETESRPGRRRETISVSQPRRRTVVYWFSSQCRWGPPARVRHGEWVGGFCSQAARKSQANDWPSGELAINWALPMRAIVPPVSVSLL